MRWIISNCTKVAETGHKLAKAMNARTILLHVISDATYYSSLNYSPIMGFGGFSNVDTIETDTAEELKRVAQKLSEEVKGISW